MKKKLKKLLAVMLACVMALSCTVFAGATAPSYDGVNMLNGEGEVNPEDTGDAADSSNVQTKYAGGSAQGIARSEGPLPADPIRLELPTVGARTLDMILDPHGLIKATNAARYSNNEDVTVDFAPDTTLYFLSTVSGDARYFSDETQKLTITNKSNLPVGVDVTLRVDKGLVNGDDFDFDFVATPEELAEAEGAAMYLALKHGDDDALNAVAAYDGGENGDEYNDIYNPPTVEIANTDALYAYIGSDVDTAAGGYPKATFQWARAAGEDDEALAEIDDVTKADFIGAIAPTSTITVAYAAAVTDDPATTDADETAPAKLTIAAASIGDYEAEIIADGIAGKNEIVNTSRDVPVTVRYYVEGEDGAEDTDVAFVYFVIKAEALEQSLTAGTVATLAVTKGDDEFSSEGWAYAKFTESVDYLPEAYVKGWDANGYYWAFVEDVLNEDGGDAKLESWGHGDIEDPPEADAYPSLSFSVVGSINGTDAKTSPWDNHGDTIALDLIWDVFAVEGEVGLAGDAPAITAVTKATGTTSSKGKATITFTPGTEDYAGYAPSAFLADGAEVEEGLVSTTETTAVVQTKDVRNATAFKLRFADANGKTFDVAITDPLW